MEPFSSLQVDDSAEVSYVLVGVMARSSTLLFEIFPLETWDEVFSP